MRIVWLRGRLTRFLFLRTTGIMPQTACGWDGSPSPPELSATHSGRARPYVPELPLLQSSLLRIKRDPRLVIAMPGRPGKRFAGKGEFSMAELDVHEPLLAATDTQSVVLGL